LSTGIERKKGGVQIKREPAWNSKGSKLHRAKTGRGRIGSSEKTKGGGGGRDGRGKKNQKETTFARSGNIVSRGKQIRTKTEKKPGLDPLVLDKGRGKIVLEGPANRSKKRLCKNGGFDPPV